MRNTKREAFSHEERKAALFALLVAALIAALAILIQQMTGPSLGPWESQQATVSMPNVLDAQPIASSV